MDIKLSPLQKQHLEFLREVRSSPKINKYLFTDAQISKKAQDNWYKNCYLKDKTRLILIAIDNKIPVGYGQITHIDHTNRSAEVIFCIAPEKQGRGYGKALVEKITNYAFKELKIHRIYLEVFSDNKKAVKLYEKSGFKKEGVFRDKIFKQGNFHDVIIMSIVDKNTK